MKKIIFALILSSLSLTSYAFNHSSLQLMFNSSDCISISNGNLTACFQNTTRDHLGDYAMKETVLYENGKFEESISNLGATQPGFFIVAETSSMMIKKDKIASVGLSIIKGDAERYQVMPGCNTEFTSTSISKSVLTAYKVGDYLYCK